MKHRSIVVLFVLSIQLIDQITSAAKVLKQIQLVTRHGSRAQLTKNALSLKEGGTATLTALGEKQCYDNGVWLLNHYNDTGFFQVYQPTQVLLQSSYFDRTITSANSLALGLFPESARDPFHENLLPTTRANVPVYSAAVEDDVTIRAYDKCAALDLEQLYQTSAWLQLQAAHTTLLTRLAQIPEFAQWVDNSTGQVPLYNVWNVFDAIQVAKTECTDDVLLNNFTSNPICFSNNTDSLVNVLTTDQWNELQQLTRNEEDMKYATQEAGYYVAGNLLNEIVGRMLTVNLTTPGVSEFYLYSAHYPVLLGLFGVLRETPVETETIPDYASIVIFELYEDTDVSTGTPSLTVNVVYKPGLQDTSVQLQLLRACPSTSPSCTVDGLAALVSNFTLADWCQQCNNTSAKPCMEIAMAAEAAASSSASASSAQNGCITQKHGRAQAAIAGVVCFIAGVMVSLAMMYLLRKPTTTTAAMTTATASSTPKVIPPPEHPESDFETASKEDIPVT